MNSKKWSLADAKSIVVKVGTSSLIYPKTGRPNLRRMEALASVLSDLMNSGKKITLVSSGAVGVGVGKLGLRKKPEDTAGKQAAATVGQCELMYLYDKFFSAFGYKVGQLLITRDDIEDPLRSQNLKQTFDKLFELEALPIINENDAVATEELVFGDNDSLSAVVAKLIQADALIMLTETEGLYTENPQINPQAELISEVFEITDEIKAFAGSAISNCGTGGMVTKLHAAEIASEVGIHSYVCSGENPEILYDLLQDKKLGTHFYPESF